MTFQRTGQKLCHVKVRDVAKAAAAQKYEAYMGADNAIYRAWKMQNPGASPKELERRFIEKDWVNCVDFARETLVKLLGQTDISDRMKEEIVDILHKDQLVRFRTVGKIMN